MKSNQMTTTDRLARIRARCVELLELASKRTPGKWSGSYERIWHHQHLKGLADPSKRDGPHALAETAWGHYGDAAFIVACAGAAEAGWRATISAIDVCLEGLCYHEDMARTILAAWEGLA